jgi:hypothetical protein
VFSETLTSPVLLPRLYEGIPTPYRPARRPLEWLSMAVLLPRMGLRGSDLRYALVPVRSFFPKAMRTQHLLPNGPVSGATGSP